ncbi:hypothetical protein [Streptomyces sp. NPDC026673]|uniref:hypothetical protein n=1 Tax=Streptomyces sp. NPDC026673 TaxID=3155724 RepID=UPI0033CFA616
MARPSSYPLELRHRAVRMVAGALVAYPNESAALKAETAYHTAATKPQVTTAI